MFVEIGIVNRATGEQEAWKEVDQKMCEALGVPQCTHTSYLDWHHFAIRIGIGEKALSLPQQLAALKDTPNTRATRKLLEWLIKHYTIRMVILFD